MNAYANLEYVGFKQKDELLQLMAESYLCVFPSECPENCPMTVIESLSVGTPVLATAMGGTAELIRPGDDGLFFKSGDVADLCEKIQWFFDHADNAAAMSANAMANAQRFGQQEYIDRLISIYEEQIKRKQTPR